MKRKMTRFARGWSIGARTASGLDAAFSRPCRAIAPKPALVWRNQARRVVVKGEGFMGGSVGGGLGWSLVRFFRSFCFDLRFREHATMNLQVSKLAIEGAVHAGAEA